MTKTGQIVLHHNGYFLHCTKEDELSLATGAYVICRDFVMRWLDYMPQFAILTASTQPLKGDHVLKVCVIKNGFYRWSYTVPQDSRFVTARGGSNVTLFAEEILNRFFPDARADGLDEPKDVWLRLQTDLVPLSGD